MSSCVQAGGLSETWPLWGGKWHVVRGNALAAAAVHFPDTRPTLRRVAGENPFRIAHISDVHCGGAHFVPSLMDRAIAEINEMEPDLVVCSGDLTTFGFKQEYLEAKGYLQKIECEAFVVIPGNHDSRNVGYVHFEQLFGDRNSVLRVRGITVVAIDSTQPDLDEGQIGRGRYGWIE